MSICWERGSPEPLMGCSKSKEERLWRAALPADECFSGPSDQNIRKTLRSEFCAFNMRLQRASRRMANRHGAGLPPFETPPCGRLLRVRLCGSTQPKHAPACAVAAKNGVRTVGDCQRRCFRRCDPPVFETANWMRCDPERARHLWAKRDLDESRCCGDIELVDCAHAPDHGNRSHRCPAGPADEMAYD